jgi:hypothetical protein
MSEFNWWLLIVGLVIGAGLVWLILADSHRRDSEISQTELPAEAAWIAATMTEAGQPLDPETAERVLLLHRAYLASLPPDELRPDVEEDWDQEAERFLEPVPEPPAEPIAPPADRPSVDGSASGTTPVWSATEPSPRRR